MSVMDMMETLSVAPHDEAAANLVDILAASAGCSAQVLERLSNPRAVQFAALARDLRLWAGQLRGQEPATEPRLRLVR
jgi:hypothetical protein